MAVYILLAFILTPIVEITVLIGVGGLIGLWPTLAIVVATAVLGTWLLRAQGLATLARARDSLARNTMPMNEVFDGACLLVAGALLLTPGFVTDAFGFVLFVPPFRSLLRQFITRRLADSSHMSVWIDGEPTPKSPQVNGIIDGEFREVRPDDDKPSAGGKDSKE